MQRNNRSQLVGFILVLIVIVVSGCTQENSQPSFGYVNEEYGFGLNPPQNWTINENSQDLVKFMCPDHHDYQINFGIKAPVVMNGTLSNVTDQLITYYNNHFKNFVLISRELTTINGVDASEIVLSEGLEPNMLQHKQALIEKNGKIYSLTYIALVVDYNTYISVIDQSIQSFTIF
jgi:hypothetical protein